MVQPATAMTVLPGAGDSVDFDGLGVNWKIDGTLTDGRFAVVHHPSRPHALAAPLHRHHNEDEFSFVLRGTMGALLGHELVCAERGPWVFKPRHQWHTFCDVRFFCLEAFVRDPWLDPVRRDARFQKLVCRAEQRHRDAEHELRQLDSHHVLTA